MIQMIQLWTRQAPCHRGKACTSVRHEASAQRCKDYSSYEEEPSGGSTGPREGPAAMQDRRGPAQVGLLRACCLQVEGRAELVRTARCQDGGVEDRVTGAPGHLLRD